MIWFLLSTQIALAQVEITEQIESAQASISEDDKRQREALSHLFVINRKIKEISKRRAKLNAKLLEREGSVRVMAQIVDELEQRTEIKQKLLNQRLRKLYHDREQSSLQWLFSSGSPMEFDRNHRYLKKMVDSGHKELKAYVTQLAELKKKREILRGRVKDLASTQKAVEVQEKKLAVQMKEKSRLIAQLRKAKNSKLSELKGLRGKLELDVLAYAFFERKGQLRPPVDAPVVKSYGTFVDSQYRFKLAHKGLFYGARRGDPVRAVADGRVVLAGNLPGYGRAIIIDHGDNYYSVYGFNLELKVSEGTEVQEGTVLSASGGASPLFGPGLYFEIRHFTDAIDPRQWIKDPVIKTAKREEST